MLFLQGCQSLTYLSGLCCAYHCLCLAVLWKATEPPIKLSLVEIAIPQFPCHHSALEQRVFLLKRQRFVQLANVITSHRKAGEAEALVLYHRNAGRDEHSQPLQQSEQCFRLLIYLQASPGLRDVVRSLDKIFGASAEHAFVGGEYV